MAPASCSSSWRSRRSSAESSSSAPTTTSRRPSCCSRGWRSCGPESSSCARRSASERRRVSPPIERSWARESPRDQAESAFTPILRRLLHRTTGVLAVCFVDDEGETVDYCAALAPYDVKVTGAHIRVIMGELGDRLKRAGAGESWLLHVGSEGRELLA